ncbi:GNAT family N-acetyltransferase [Microvirga rosea]|uniref:GNAT family N-acetyltransferase n=1 Tax=Microvirga rosea TaxID=2715425 RepID=UPI001D0B94F9|nr:GNAT family N-acetyltransferase [Microvirga rosea]MCB8819154.1 GNAT family N-acetyltransferase [Microvirga rosea]
MAERLVLRMRRSLTAPVPAPSWPDGIRLAAFDPDHHARDVHALLVAAYARGGGEVAPYDAWLPALTGDAEYDAALCFVAVDDRNAVAGVAQCWTSAFIKDLAVRADHRRQGLGSALLLHAFRRFRERGAPFVDLKVDSDNPSGALRLYRAHGMQQIEAYRLP